MPGDVIRLRLGDIVPADARLLDGDEVSVDQSALTGESLPATCKSGDAVFSGSIIRRGEIGALVYATGANTYFGKTAELVQDAHTVSHFQTGRAEDRQLPDHPGGGAGGGDHRHGASMRGDPILTHPAVRPGADVAAIPVAMPTVLSVTMAVGARLLAKKQAIVSKLVAIEELAGVDVLCADKTGTLTQNKLTLGRSVLPSIGITADQVILDGALASRADNDDTIDLAVLGGLKDNTGAEALSGHSFPAVRPGAQTHRGHRQGRGRQDVQGHQGRAAGHPGVVGQCRAGQARRRQGRQRFRRARLSCRWAWPGPMATATGSFSVCCRCSIRRVTTPRPPSRPRPRWASRSRW